MINKDFIPSDFESLLSNTSLGYKTLIELCDDGDVLFQAHDYELADPIRVALIRRYMKELLQGCSRRKMPDKISDLVNENLSDTLTCISIPFVDDIMHNDVVDVNIMRRVLVENAFSYKYLDLFRLFDILLQRSNPSYRLAIHEMKRQEKYKILH